MEQESHLNVPRHHHRKDVPDKFLKLRNVLNLIFMLGAIVGVAAYMLSDQDTGIYIIMGSMAFKVVECTLRFIH